MRQIFILSQKFIIKLEQIMLLFETFYNFEKCILYSAKTSTIFQNINCLELKKVLKEKKVNINKVKSVIDNKYYINISKSDKDLIINSLEYIIKTNSLFKTLILEKTLKDKLADFDLDIVEQIDSSNTNFNLIKDIQKNIQNFEIDTFNIKINEGIYNYLDNKELKIINVKKKYNDLWYTTYDNDHILFDKYYIIPLLLLTYIVMLFYSEFNSFFENEIIFKTNIILLNITKILLSCSIMILVKYLPISHYLRDFIQIEACS